MKASLKYLFLLLGVCSSVYAQLWSQYGVMTYATRTNLTSPPKGMLVYQTDQTNGLFSFDGSLWGIVGSTTTYDANQFLLNGSSLSIKSAAIVSNLTEKANFTIFGGSGAYESIGTGSSGTYMNRGNTTLYGSPTIFDQIVRNGFGGIYAVYEDSTPLYIMQSSTFKVVDTVGAGQAFFAAEQSSQNVGAGKNSLAVGDTAGFFGIASVNGVPTGTPSVFSFGANFVPMTVDRAGNNLYFYSGGKWRTSLGPPQTTPAGVVSIGDLIWPMSDTVDAISGRISGLQSLTSAGIMAIDQRLNLSTNGFTLIVSMATQTNGASAWTNNNSLMLLATDMDNPQHEGQLQMFIKAGTFYLDIFRTNNSGNLTTNETTWANFAYDPSATIPYANGSIGHWQLALNPATTNLSLLINGVWYATQTYNDIAPARAITGVGVGTSTNLPIIGKINDSNPNNVVVFKWNLFNYARATNSSGVVGEDYGTGPDASQWADFGSGTNGVTIKFDMNSVDTTIVNSIPNVGPANYNLQFTNQYSAANNISTINPHGLGYYKDLRAGNLAVRTNATVSGNIVMDTAGKNFKIKEGTVGSASSMGLATLSSGSSIITNSLVTANSRIFLTYQSNGGSLGNLSVSSRVAATSFTISSTSGSDTNNVAWFLIEPN